MLKMLDIKNNIKILFSINFLKILIFLKILFVQEIPPRRRFYLAVLTEVRIIMISRMAKPEEVLVVENDQGEVVREQLKDTDSINLYKTMRETLVYLTHLDHKDTENIMTTKLAKQVNFIQINFGNLRIFRILIMSFTLLFLV